MRLKDVLALPKSIDSLELLKNYLNQPLSYDEYMAAFLHYASILLEAKYFDRLIQDCNEAIFRYNLTTYDEKMDHVYSILVDTYIEKNQINEAIHIIETRKNTLPYPLLYKVYKQELNCKKTLNHDLLTYLEDILEMTMPLHVYRDFLVIYVEILLEQHKFDIASTVIDDAMLKLSEPLLELRLPTLLGLQKYDEILNLIQKHPSNMTPFILFYLMSSYIGLKQYQKAINLEVEYETLMEEDSRFQLRFYELILSMYQSLHNNLSIKEYESRINRLKNQLKKKNKHIEPEKEKIIPLDDKVFTELETKKTHTKNFEQVLIFWSKISTLPLEKPYRELLRHIGIWSQELSPFQVFVVYFMHEKTLYFYKKDRLYDKKIKPDQLEHTMISYMLERDIEGYFDVEHFKHRKDILTEKPYDNVHHIYGYKNEMMLMLSYYDQVDPYYGSEDDILQSMFYSMYQLYHYKFTLDTHMFHSDMYHMLLKHPNLHIRVFKDGVCEYSHELLNQFSIRQSSTLQEFTELLSLKDQVSYQTHIKNLYNFAHASSTITFQIDNKTYHEHAIVKMYQESPLIISFFHDSTESDKLHQSALEYANTDKLTNLPNFSGFLHDFETIILDKVTFLYIALSKDITYLYGQKSYSQYFKEFVHLTKKICDTEKIYIMDPQHMIVILPYNDIRAVTKMIRVYMDKVLSWLPKSIPQEPFLPYVGSLRYPVVTTERKPEIIMSYLDIALNKAYQLPYPFTHDFQYSDFETDQKEQYILDQIHEAINHKQFSIGFHQIIDQANNKVFLYESFAYIAHLDIDEKDIKKIAKKRKRIFEFDIAHIETVSKMLFDMHALTQKYIKILIPVDKDTLTHHQALEKIKAILTLYHIPQHVIQFNVEGDFKASIYAMLFEDLHQMGIDLHVSSLKTALYYPTSALHFDIKYPDQKMISYLKMIQAFCLENHMTFIIRNVMNKEIKQQLLKEGLPIIEGSIYKRLTQEHLFTKVQQK